MGTLTVLFTFTMVIIINSILGLTMQIFERRAKEVKPSEANFWHQITPEMMSDEEKQGEVFIRRQPSYRSQELNKFLSKLDKRYEKKPSHQPRITRVMGSPIIKDVPRFAKRWMVVSHLSNSIEAQEDELSAIKARFTSFLHAGSGPHHRSEKAQENFCLTLLCSSIYLL